MTASALLPSVIAWPPSWTRLGRVSAWLAKALPLQRPRVVLLSLPRSGSTWVGGLLGSAANAAYLHEPLTQTQLAQGGTLTLFPFPLDEPPAAYRQSADLAFGGRPQFSLNGKTVPFPEQWSLAQRPRRRRVMKEVNPYLGVWLAKTYAPRLITLLRHPAALALSYRKLGWWPSEKPWEQLGRRFSQALHAARQQLEQQPQVRYITYESICLDPLPCFAGLFEFAGLTWDPAVEERVRRQSSSCGDSSPWSTTRLSPQMVDGWRCALTAAQLAELKAGYFECPLPWYQAPEDW